jgi:hypothetical protein
VLRENQYPSRSATADRAPAEPNADERLNSPLEVSTLTSSAAAASLRVNEYR